MATWPTTLPAPQKNIGIVPGDTRKDRKLQSGRSEFRRFGDGKPDQMKTLFRLTWAEWDTFKEFYAHELNLSVNWFSADWLTDLGYDSHKARILGYPREIALQNHYVDVLCNLIIQKTAWIVGEDTEWPCEPTGAEPSEPEPGPEGYIIGGDCLFTGELKDCDRYTAETNIWTNMADMPLPGRYRFAASTIGNSFYTYCGFDDAVVIQDCDKYTPNVWISKTSAPTTRSRHAASTIGSYGYIYGGYHDLSCYSYEPSGDSWANKTDLPLPNRYSLGASTIDNKGYVYCGHSEYGVTLLQDCDEYDPNIDTWSSKTNAPLPARTGVAASTIGSAGYIYGGFSALQDCDEYIAAGDVWANKTDISVGVKEHAASTIGSAGYVYDTNAHCLRFAANTWTNMANYPAPTREYHTATTL